MPMIQALKVNLERTITKIHLIVLMSITPVFSAALVPAVYPSNNTTATLDEPVPLLAYYYIWFDEKSWERAKVDYPLLGRYSSDDAEVMRQHIAWAKEAGIDGFIVSWKSTDKLNPRLEQLAELAAQENFKLAIIYQGLDFYRDPLKVEKIAADLDYFMAHYASQPAFELYQKPLVIWSGTWEFSREEIQAVTESKRDQLLILASEKNVKGYQRLSDLVDGNAYYWSSVNPATFPGYVEKLTEMGEEIHANNGLWIAPAAPGFDARLVGGKTVVERQDGKLLQIEMNAALQSNPDAIGLISWNEFSENSHVEPSVNYGNEYLETLKNIQHTPVPEINEFDSSIPGSIQGDFSLSRLIAMALLTGLFLLSLTMIVLRANRNNNRDGET